MVGALASPPMWFGFHSRTRHHMWVEFVVGSRPCSERFFSGYSGFFLSSKTKISKFQFDLESVFNKYSALNALTLKFIYLFIYLFIYSFIYLFLVSPVSFD